MKYLLVNIPEEESVFGESKISIALPMLPPASLAMLAAVLIEEKQEVKVLDLRISKKIHGDFEEAIRRFNPDCIGMTFTTPLFENARKLILLAKKINKRIIGICGGAHSSALPEETLKNSEFDIAVVGEGEETLREIAQGKSLLKIKGICYKRNGKIFSNSRRELIQNLDKLPFPAWHLFELSRYHTSRLSCKKNPVGPLETSRGCIYGCVYCSKCTFGKIFRKKSAKRVVDEIEFALNSGFKEIHIMDDMFSTDLKRAKQICDEILKRKLVFPWCLINGIRVDWIDKELLIKLKEAGCYRIAFGVESGNDEVLRDIKKGINVSQVKKAFRIANEAGMETIAFCMMGLPKDSKKSMRETIELMKEVKPTLPKASILLPLPGTPLFEEWDRKGLILSKRWKDYSFHSKKKVYRHPYLKEEEINEYYNKFWRELILSPEFVLRRFIRDIKNGEIFYDIYYFFRTLGFGW